MEAALRHIHQTGTFPVSCSPSPSPNPLPHFAPPSCPSSSPSHRARRLSHRSSHGCISPPLPPSPSSTDRKLTNQTFVASKEDQNTVGACPVPDSVISAQKSRVASWLGPGRPGRALLDSGTTICLLDGFLLYTPAVAPVMSSLDIKLFLLVSRDQATRRREARDGYVTLEGFWKDPPGYVDRIVWPNYAENHAWLFEDGNVEGRLREDVLRENGIRAQVGRGLDVDMSTTLEWAVGVIMEELERLVLGKGDSGAE
ncbi:hypothetical protein BR93DRAFT_930589 [Coniochaeta sp. PMI_546]|nr:hypothetical protein BR93DRAFT_930589 [Coniochaeta sp. PMI_546]